MWALTTDNTVIVSGHSKNGGDVNYPVAQPLSTKDKYQNCTCDQIYFYCNNKWKYCLRVG